jgi:SAM-dependent methyltransferase
MDLKELQSHWDALGAQDPLYGVLSDPSKRGNAWEAAEFFATGEAEVAGLLERLQADGEVFGRGCALDFGCGVGRLSQALAARFERVLAVDVAPSMLARARALAPPGLPIEWVLNERPDLAVLPDASVDLLYSHIVLQHIPPALALGYIGEFVRVLKPGGLAVFQVPERSEDAAWRQGLKRWLPKRLLQAYRRARYGPAAVVDVEVQMNGIPPAQVRDAVRRSGGALEARGGGWYRARRA